MISLEVHRLVFKQCRVAIATWVLVLVMAPLSTVGLSQTVEKDGGAADKPLALDLSKKVHVPIRSVGEVAALAGKREFDGVPFQVDGVIRLYGRTPETNRQEVYPESVTGIEVGRSFKELHLVHYAMWPDVVGDAVANIVLHFADGTTATLPIQYGVHVLDWSDLPSYAEEVVSDPNTRICYRRPPPRYNAPLRIFQSALANPFPDKTVEAIDVVSTKNLSSYNLLAATVGNTETIPNPELPAKKGFDAKIKLRVVDDANGEPIEGALVQPGLLVEDIYLVGSPYRTSQAGDGVIPFPTKTTKSLTARVSKAGYEDGFESWEVPAAAEATIRLRRGGVE
jgi:hypothetical protein